MATHPAPRGFTLIEAMITLAISASVIALGLGAANMQKRATVLAQRLRTAQASSRDALLYLERTVPLAGFGMDAALAVDLQWYAPGTCPPEIASCDRDRIDDADELVFYARNPSFWVPPVEWVPAVEGDEPPAFRGKAWRLALISDDAITLDAHQGDLFLANQILQVVCPGTLNYAYVTVGAETPAGAPLAADTDDLAIPLLESVESNPFRRQDVAVELALGDKCRVFQIDRFRLHVVPVAMDDGSYNPFLVLDDGVHPETLLAEGVEAFQVAFVLQNGSVVGADPGTVVGLVAANSDQTVTDPAAEQLATTAFPGVAPPSGQTKYWPSSFYRYGYDSDTRRTIHQANIRAVRIGLVVRSPTPHTAEKANWVLENGLPLLNQDAVSGWIADAPKLAFGTDGYQRVRVETTINLPNMLVRSLPAF